VVNVIFITKTSLTTQIAALSRRLSGCLHEALPEHSKLLIFSTVLSKGLMFYKLFCVGLLPPFILAVAASAHAQSFPRERLGDAELGCQALYDGVQEMDAMIAANAPSQTTAANQTAGSAAKELTDAATRETRSAEVAKFGNLLGRLTSGFGADQQNQQQIETNKAQARDSAAARKQYLTSLFNSKKCKVSTLRK
jgi:hypothetical protein